MAARDDPAEAGSVRTQIQDTVAAFPGIHLRGIVKQLDTSTALARYHLDHLVADGLVREIPVGGFTRYFPAATYGELTPKERRALQVLRQERPLEIVLTLLELGPQQHRDLLELVGGSKGTLSYHLDKLVAAGLVRKVPRGPERGFHLVDPKAVRRLLARYEPLPEIYEQVHDLWEELFSGHRRGARKTKKRT